MTSLQRFGVLGWPVAHSRSPAMHNAAFAHLGLDDHHYQKLPVPPELFAETVRALAHRFRGANVTIPHKQQALAIADEATETARRIGAANTLTFKDGRIHADNTDARGVVDAMRPADVQGRTALVWGAGGSARAVVHALLAAGAQSVHVWNRTNIRAVELCEVMGGRPITWTDVSHNRFDIAVNCTSIGLENPGMELKALPRAADQFSTGTLLVDMVYRTGGTALLREAREHGADVVDGLEVLVMQGAASFERWTGSTAPRDVMRQAAQDTETTHAHRDRRPNADDPVVPASPGVSSAAPAAREPDAGAERDGDA